MRQLGLAIAFSLAMFAGRAVVAGEGCGAKCPSCDYTCEMTVDNSPVKKHCWRVEYKPVCIPKVTFPWQRGCDSCGKSGKGGKGCAGCNGCAKVKYVKVLVKEEYECPSCKCKFTPVPCGKGYKESGNFGDYEGDNGNSDVPPTPPEVRNNYGAPAPPARVSVGSIRGSRYDAHQATATEDSKKNLYQQIRDLLK